MRLIERKVMSYECILFLIFKMKCCILYSFAVVVWRNVDADVVRPHRGVSWEPPEPDGHACLTACLHVSLFCRRKYGDWGEVPHSFLWLYHVFILTLYFGAEFSYESCLECDAHIAWNSRTWAIIPHLQGGAGGLTVGLVDLELKVPPFCPVALPTRQ